MSIIGLDSFQRPNNPSTWNPSSDGQSWSNVRGGGIYAVSNDEGVVTGTTAESVELLGTSTAQNFDITVRLSRYVSLSTSQGIVCRVTGSTTYYKFRLKSGLLEITKVVSGVTTVLNSVSYTVSLGQFYWMHIQLNGSVLSARTWVDGSDEPTGWMVSANDSSITGVGQYGLFCTLQPGDAASFDSFICDNLVSNLLPDNPYGFTVLNKSPIPTNTLQDIVSMGAAWIRPQTNWALMERTDDGSRGSTLSSVIDWSLMDDIVDKCATIGLRVCLTIQNPPAWHCTQGINAATQIPNPLDTIAFAKALVARYNGTNHDANGKTHGPIQAVMFNEDWDAFSAGWPGGTGGSYNPSYTSRDFSPLGSILPTLYPYAKAQNPSILVGCASTLGKRTDATHIYNLISSLWSSGCWGYVDFIDLHFYNCAAPPTAYNNNLNDPPLAARLAAMKNATTAAGHAGGIDIWMTEFGYQVNNGGPVAVCDVTASQQSAYLRESMDIAASLGVSHYFIWTIGSKDNNSIVQGSGSNRTYMPSYNDIKNYIAEGGSFVGHYVIFPTVSRRTGIFTQQSRRTGLLPQISRRQSG